MAMIQEHMAGSSAHMRVLYFCNGHQIGRRTHRTECTLVPENKGVSVNSMIKLRITVPKREYKCSLWEEKFKCLTDEKEGSIKEIQNWN
jgi:hypothetical protein